MYSMEMYKHNLVHVCDECGLFLHASDAQRSYMIEKINHEIQERRDRLSGFYDILDRERELSARVQHNWV